MISSPALSPDAGVHLTGGEPLLHPDFEEIYAGIRARLPGRLMSISSSGEPPQAVLGFLRRKPDLRSTLLVFSYDGAGRHDRQRGSPGAERRLLGLLREVAPTLPRGRLFARMTITPENADAVWATFLELRELGVGMQIREAGHYPEYTNSVRPPGEITAPLPPPLRARLLRELSSVFNAMSPLRDNQEQSHLLSLIERLSRGRAAPPGPCAVPFMSAFVRSDGGLLTCRGAAPVGNVLTDGLEAVWDSAANGRLRLRGCGACEPWFSECS